MSLWHVKKFVWTSRMRDFLHSSFELWESPEFPHRSRVWKRNSDESLIEKNVVFGRSAVDHLTIVRSSMFRRCHDSPSDLISVVRIQEEIDGRLKRAVVLPKTERRLLPRRFGSPLMTRRKLTFQRDLRDEDCTDRPEVGGLKGFVPGQHPVNDATPCVHDRCTRTRTGCG